eukprot:gene10476-biopygen18302
MGETTPYRRAAGHVRWRVRLLPARVGPKGVSATGGTGQWRGRGAGMARAWRGHFLFPHRGSQNSPSQKGSPRGTPGFRPQTPLRHRSEIAMAPHPVWWSADISDLGRGWGVPPPRTPPPTHPSSGGPAAWTPPPPPQNVSPWPPGRRGPNRPRGLPSPSTFPRPMFSGGTSRAPAYVFSGRSDLFVLGGLEPGGQRTCQAQHFRVA